MILRLSIATQLSINLLFAGILVFIFDERMNRMCLPIQIDEIGKNQDRSINETSVSSISTDWSIQSISIKSDLPIFIDWLLRDIQGPLSRLTLLSNTVNLWVHDLPSCVLKPQTCYYSQLCLLVNHLLSAVIKAL